MTPEQDTHHEHHDHRSTPTRSDTNTSLRMVDERRCARGRGDAHHTLTRHTEKTPTPPRGRESSCAGRSGTLEKTDESGVEKVLDLLERSEPLLERGRLRRIDGSLGSIHVAHEQAYHESNDPRPISPNDAVDDQGQLSAQSYSQKVFERAWARAELSSSREGSSLREAVFEHAGGCVRPLVGSGGPVDGEGWGKALGHTSLAGRSWNNLIRCQDEHNETSVAATEDRPSSLCSVSPCDWPSETSSADIPQTGESTDVRGTPALSLPIQQPPRVSGCSQNYQAGGRPPEHHRFAKACGTESSQGGPDCESGGTFGSPPGVQIDEALRGQSRCAGETLAVADDKPLDALYKGRLMAFLNGQMLKLPQNLPLRLPQTYASSEGLSALLLKEVTYSGLIGELVQPPTFFSTPEMPESSVPHDTTFNVPAVETLRWETILPFIPTERRAVVEVILNEKKFRDIVLRKDAQFPPPQNCRLPSMPFRLQEEIIRLGYLRSPGRIPLVTCPIFSVPRPDGKKRLIWDGRNLNALCNPPPPFHFQPLAEMLAHLMQSEIATFITFDLRSWFVQLRPNRKIARFFATRLKKGFFILTGLPMGWCWAPIIAQFVAEGFVHKVTPLLPRNVIIFVYIDNIIVGIPKEHAGDGGALLKIITQQAEICGIVIKDTSITLGSTAPWLGTELCATQHEFRLKPAFIHKLSQLWAAVREKSCICKRTWYILLSCLIHMVWVSQEQLCTIAPVIKTMSDIGRTIVGSSSWEEEYQVLPSVRSMIDMEMQIRLRNDWKPFPSFLRPSRPCACGFSDASQQARAWAFHSPSAMVLEISQNSPSSHSIFSLELQAMVEGQIFLSRELPRGSAYVWLADNTAAIFVCHRGVSCVWEVNSCLETLYNERKTREIHASLAYIPTKLNPVDGASRSKLIRLVRAPSCPQHPGQPCPHFLSWITAMSS